VETWLVEGARSRLLGRATKFVVESLGESPLRGVPDTWLVYKELFQSHRYVLGVRLFSSWRNGRCSVFDRPPTKSTPPDESVGLQGRSADGQPEASAALDSPHKVPIVYGAPVLDSSGAGQMMVTESESRGTQSLLGVFSCPRCDRVFRSKTGLSVHQPAVERSSIIRLSTMKSNNPHPSKRPDGPTRSWWRWLVREQDLLGLAFRT